MGRKDAERQLLGHGNQRGTFLIRESETTKGERRALNTHASRSPPPPPYSLPAAQVPSLCPSATGTTTRATTSSTIRSASWTTGATTSPPGLSLTPCSSWWSTTKVSRRFSVFSGLYFQKTKNGTSQLLIDNADLRLRQSKNKPAAEWLQKSPDSPFGLDSTRPVPGLDLLSWCKYQPANIQDLAGEVVWVSVQTDHGAV